MQKVYLMSEFGTLFDPRTGEHSPVESSGRITSVCALRPEDVIGEYGYLAVVEQVTDTSGKLLEEATTRHTEPVDVPLVREAIMIINQRAAHVVN